MKVLFDITTLGLGHKNFADKTGIARVVENLAVQLLTLNTELKFCADMGIQEVKYSSKYLDNTTLFYNVPFSRPVFFSNRLRISEKKEEALDIILNRKEKNIAEKLSSRWCYKAMIYKEKIWNNYTAGFIDPKDVNEADIYHSPFLPIPKQIRRAGKQNVFITSHDIIALLYPQFVVPSIGKLVKDIVQSITPDTWVLCVSDATRNDLLNYLGKKINPDKTIVTYLATSDLFYVDDEKSKDDAIRKKYKIFEGPYILSVGTLEPRKNINQVIKAFSKLIKEQHINDLKLVLVGNSGWLYESIFDEIDASGDLKKRIIVTGYVADEDLSALYSNALMFVYPSFYEGFGLPPLEAMKCGTPVITSNTSSLPEVVGDAGIKINPTDLDSLCNSILTVYSNAFVREEMIRKSLEQAKKFSWEKCARDTVEAYGKALL